MMVGSAMYARMIEPVKAVRPVGRLSVSRTTDDKITIPKNPNTTDGMPATISIIGFRISRSQRGAISAMKMAVNRPIGMAMRAAPIVTTSEPKSSGRMPK